MAGSILRLSISIISHQLPVIAVVLLLALVIGVTGLNGYGQLREIAHILADKIAHILAGRLHFPLIHHVQPNHVPAFFQFFAPIPSLIQPGPLQGFLPSTASHFSYPFLHPIFPLLTALPSLHHLSLHLLNSCSQPSNPTVIFVLKPPFQQFPTQSDCKHIQNAMKNGRLCLDPNDQSTIPPHPYPHVTNCATTVLPNGCATL